MIMVDAKKMNVRWKYGGQVKRTSQWRQFVKQIKEEMIGGRDEFKV